MKICKKCNTEKPVEDFNQGKAYAGGRKAVCKECISAYNKTRYVPRPENLQRKIDLELARKAKLEKKEAIAEERRLKKETEKPIKDAIKKEKRAAYNRMYRAKHPGCRRIEKKNRKLKVRTSGKLSRKITDKLIGLQKGKCAICAEKLNGTFHIDHVIPIALNGTNTDDNIQLLCPACNLKKGATHPIDFMQSIGKLL